ncbi:hypothetical protein B0I35DRAFT_264967 [Stachybotrys elegans]|uniref:Uncharacterized protein n=1 Tax=Stachybotrys elegans TaxID=80388 RepID=A0A8K0SMR2_9HYPO|nr:hypothetical protein B0I35DRAFT_264967 [Stachybotrys elegans]
MRRKSKRSAAKPAMPRGSLTAGPSHWRAAQETFAFLRPQESWGTRYRWASVCVHSSLPRVHLWTDSQYWTTNAKSKLWRPATACPSALSGGGTREARLTLPSSRTSPGGITSHTMRRAWVLCAQYPYPLACRRPERAKAEYGCLGADLASGVKMGGWARPLTLFAWIESSWIAGCSADRCAWVGITLASLTLKFNIRCLSGVICSQEKSCDYSTFLSCEGGVNCCGRLLPSQD